MHLNEYKAITWKEWLDHWGSLEDAGWRLAYTGEDDEVVLWRTKRETVQ